MKQFVKENQEAKDQSIVIISAERYDKPQDENDIRTKWLDIALTLSGIPHHKAQGCYKGTSEESFVCLVDSPLDTRLVDLAISFEQESILVRADDGIFLLYPSRDYAGTDFEQTTIKFERIGDKIKAVSPAYAETQDAYTIMNGRCYIVA